MRSCHRSTDLPTYYHQPPDITELIMGLKKRGLTGLTDLQLSGLHGDCDVNNDGQITLEEFVSMNCARIELT